MRVVLLKSKPLTPATVLTHKTCYNIPVKPLHPWHSYKPSHIFYNPNVNQQTLIMTTNLPNLSTSQTAKIIALINYKIRRDRTDNIPNRYSKALLAEKCGTTPQTLSDWSHGNERANFRAYSAHVALTLLGFGGLTFDEVLTEKECQFKTIHTIFVKALSQTWLSNNGLASRLGWSNGNTLRLHAQDYGYFMKNMRLFDLEKLALLLGLGRIKPHIAAFRGIGVHGLDGAEPGEEAASPIEVESFEPPEALIESVPHPYGLHLPVRLLVETLTGERKRRGLGVEDLRLPVADDVVRRWEDKRIMFTKASSRHDLTLELMSAWSQALGFGRLLTPCLGYNWREAVYALQLTAKERPRLGGARMAQLIGPQMMKEIRANGQAFEAEKMPVAMFEYLCLWAYGDGLAFERDTVDGFTHESWSYDRFREAGDKLRDTVRRLAKGEHLRIRERFQLTGASPINTAI